MFPNQAPDVYMEVTTQCSWDLTARRVVVVWKPAKIRVLGIFAVFRKFAGSLGKIGFAKAPVHYVPDHGVVKPLRGAF